MRIYSVKINKETQRQIFDELLTYVSREEMERIKRFKKYEDALRGLTANILLRFVIVSTIGKTNTSISFDKNEHGKPHIIGVNDFHFNLSHSGEWVVCAVDNQPVGIDVEEIRDVDLNIARRFFSEEENLSLLSLQDDKKKDYFFALWTLKESYIKADGRGLSIPLSSFSFKISGKFIDFSTTNQLKDCHFKQYQIDEFYKLAVCSLNSEFPEIITNMSFNELYNLAKIHLK